jgi:hypothetical protein
MSLSIDEVFIVRRILRFTTDKGSIRKMIVFYRGLGTVVPKLPAGSLHLSSPHLRKVDVLNNFTYVNCNF